MACKLILTNNIVSNNFIDSVMYFIILGKTALTEEEIRHEFISVVTECQKMFK